MSKFDTFVYVLMGVAGFGLTLSNFGLGYALGLIPVYVLAVVVVRRVRGTA
jgi:hypothetical protein